MENDFLASVQHEEGVEVLNDSSSPKTDEVVTETPATPPVENTTKTDKPSQGGEDTPDENLPFHKHPRWKATQDELDRLRKFEADAKPRLETYEQMMNRLGQANPSSTVQIPEWFPKTGNQKVDEQKYQEYLNYEGGVKAQIKQELIDEQVKEAQKKATEEKKWTDWVESSLDKLEKEGNKFDRNELQKVALEYLPTDLNGNVDFGKALKILNQLKVPQQAIAEAKSDARKKLADTANSSMQRADKPPSKIQNQRTLRNKSWDALIRE